MSRNSSNLLSLDVDKLFEERGIEEIIELEKLLDAEIERKRSELRSMVGDRYKDVLSASDAIKSMETISQQIVHNIENITSTCEKLISTPITVETTTKTDIDQEKIEIRTVIVQIRLAIFLNEQIWLALDNGNNLDAAQYYLLVQHVHTGLSLLRTDLLNRLVILQQLKVNLSVLRRKIFEKITEKLESVEIDAKETSCNLNALFLLENQSNNELLSVFVEHRKTALNTVINSSYSSVRVQISAMVRCLVTTVLLLHDCFIYTKQKNGLIWQQLEDIVGENAQPTLSKLQLPVTPLLSYIPQIVKEFRPKCKISNHETTVNDMKQVLKTWLQTTQETVKIGLEKTLKQIPNVRGLHLTREESLKTDLPENWSKICIESQLPENFDVWYNFFQPLITSRAKQLITKIASSNVSFVQNELCNTLNSPQRSELDLRTYVWNEDDSDVSRTENKHFGLTLKCKGYSRNIERLCVKFDEKYSELLEDVSCYLHGKELHEVVDFQTVLRDFKFKRKYIDKSDLENHLRTECSKTALNITSFISDLLSKESADLVAKSIFCARFLQAASKLCHNFNKCCTFNNVTDDWHKICDNFTKTSHGLWTNWIEDASKRTETLCQEFEDFSPRNTLKNLARWDEIDIEEQTDDRVFTSQIRVPSKASVTLTTLVTELNETVCRVLPFTLPKQIHVRFIETNAEIILKRYAAISDNEMNQIVALQCLFDVKYLTTLCVPRENTRLIGFSQNTCDKLRSKIDPFDLDVFYSYLQNNVRRAALQSQMIFGCLLPSPIQLVNVGDPGKRKEQETTPSILALSVPATNAWFPMLPVTVPSQKTTSTKKETTGNVPKLVKTSPKKAVDTSSVMRQSASSLFGGLTTDWFS